MPGFYCEVGTAKPTPCAAGHFGNATGLHSDWQCTPAPIDFWAPLGSALPKACPASGFYCPGALRDELYGGAEPIIMPIGQTTRQEEVPAVTKAMTLDMSVDDFAGQRDRLITELAARYGVITSLLTLQAAAGSLQLTITIATIDSNGNAVDIATLQQAVAAIDDVALATTISAVIGTTVNVISQPATTSSVHVTIPFPCARGVYCSAGMIFACPNNTYQPELNVISAQGCQPCIANSITNGSAKTSMADCHCDEANGYIEILFQGRRSCVCAEGYQQNEATPPTCEPCPLGAYKDSKDNILCTACDQDTTTVAVGATNKSLDCVCLAGKYDANVQPTSTRCLTCPQNTQCVNPATTLESLPLVPGYWRQSRTAIQIRPCFTAAACHGGPNVSCAMGQTGPYCAVCADGYFGGGDGVLCEPCEGFVFLTVLPSIIIGVSMLLVLTYGIVRCWRSKALAAAAVHADATDTTLNLQEKIEQVITQKVEQAVTRRLRPRVWRKLTGATIKVRIVISLFQMLGGIGITYSIQYPPVYLFVLNFLSSIFQLDLPSAMPFGCFIDVGFFSSLIARTAIPLLIIVLLAFCGRVAQRVGQHDLSGLCSSGWFYILFLVYPSCSSAVFQALICDPLEDGTQMLRVDYSVTCWEGHHLAIVAYAVAMTLIYPIGTPALYAALLYAHRKPIERIRSVELAATAEDTLMQQRRLWTLNHWNVYPKPDGSLTSESGSIDYNGTLNHTAPHDGGAQKTTHSAHELRKKLPSFVQKLTAGYQMRCYWFEIFECFRKILLVGLPVFLPMGSAAQLTTGLIICFITAMLYAAYSPYLDQSDGRLATACQVTLHFALVSSILLKMERDTSADSIGVLLIISMAIPPLIAFIFQTEVDMVGAFGLARVTNAISVLFERTVGACIVYLLEVPDEAPMTSGAPSAANMRLPSPVDLPGSLGDIKGHGDVTA